MPSMHHWGERVSYSVAHDCEMARISGYDDHAREHWVMIEIGAGFRERREAAIERIMHAIEDGNEPGQVEFNYENEDES